LSSKKITNLALVRVTILVRIMDMPKPSKFPNRIREQREALGWSQEQLAEKVRVTKAVGGVVTEDPTTPQQISRLELGERGLNDKWLTALSEAMDISKVDLIVEKGFVPSLDPGSGDSAKRQVERRLLGFWRRLSPEDQDIILRAVDAWARRLDKLPGPD
jgi:transcriptional regulator with XRE-family HTH domain